MRRLAALLLLAPLACAPVWVRPTAADYALLVAGEVAIGLDCWQSAGLRRDGVAEQNPLVVAAFGLYPSPGQFVVVGATAMAVNAFVWWYLSGAWPRRITSGAVLAGEASFVVLNFTQGRSLRLSGF